MYDVNDLPANVQTVDVPPLAPFETHPVDHRHNPWLGKPTELKTKSVLEEIHAPSRSISRDYSYLTESKVQECLKLPIPKSLKTAQGKDFACSLITYEWDRMPDAERQKILDGDGLLEWQQQHRNNSSFLYTNIPRPSNIILYTSRKYGLTSLEATHVLLRLFEINFDDIFTPIPPYRLTPNNALHSPVFNIMPNFCISGIEYTIVGADPQYGRADYLEQCVITYKSTNGEKIHLMATLSQCGHQYELSIGHGKIQAHLLSHVDIDRNPRARVIIFCDLDQAVDLRKRASSVYHGLENIIISGYFGGTDALEVLDVSILNGKEVVIIPGNSLKSIREAEQLYEKCFKAYPRSLKIFLGVIAFSNELPQCDMHSLPSWQQSFLKNTVTIRSDAPFDMALEDIFDRAVNENAYNQWKKDHALSGNDETPDASPLAIESSSPIQCQRLANITTASRDHNMPISIDEFFRAEFSTMLWGASDVGKSWIAVYFTISIILGHEAFFLAASPRSSKRSVGYIDGEIGDENLKQRFNQICACRNIALSDIEQHLDFICLNGKSLIDHTVQQQVLTMASENAWEAIVIDNIQACAPEAVKGKALDLNSFILRLKQAEIAVFSINHAKKYGNKYKGDGALEDLSKNIISLTNPNNCDDDILCLDEDDPTMVTVQMTVQKCKVDGNTFKNKSSIYQLPIGGTWEYVGGNLPHFDGSTPPPAPAEPLPLPEGEESTADATQDVDPHKEFVRSLHPQEKDLYHFMKQKHSFTRTDIEKHFKVSGKTARNKLNTFIKAGIVTLHGGKGNKNTHYTFNS